MSRSQEATKTTHDDHQIKDRLAQKTEELRRAEEQIAELRQELEDQQAIVGQQEKLASVGMLAAGVAHEINNPIGYVSSMLNTIEKYNGRIFEIVESYRALHLAEGGTPDKQTLDDLDARWRKGKIDFAVKSLPKLVGRCKEGTERVKKIVSDLRSFSRTDEQAVSEFDLNEVIEMSLNISWNELKYKAEVVRDLTDSAMVAGSSSKLASVFVNLLVNAAQALDKQGTITVTSRVAGGTVIATVADTGKGIAPEDLSKIFDPFFTTKPVGQGTGLGLNVAYNIVQQHHGRIWAESELGVGTTFFMELPLVGVQG